ncbi:MAG: hypothetical protein O3B64_01175 [bacterium]|nr:hypothetical protein [bacterium]
MPTRHQLGRKRRRAIEAANEVVAARIRRKKKAKRLAKQDAETK